MIYLKLTGNFLVGAGIFYGGLWVFRQGFFASGIIGLFLCITAVGGFLRFLTFLPAMQQMQNLKRSYPAVGSDIEKHISKFGFSSNAQNLTPECKRSIELIDMKILYQDEIMRLAKESPEDLVSDIKREAMTNVQQVYPHLFKSK